MRGVLHHLTATLFACALALRLAIAPGLMPVATAHGVQMVACAGQLGGEHGKPVRPSCPFAAVAAPAVAPDAPMLAPALLPTRPLASIARERPRAHGPPARRPPSTGPPAIA